MKLRIVSGTLGRRKIVVPDRFADFRPTLERKRQAIADSLGTLVTGARVADCCAGSGAVGFELLSRGASSVDFIEVDQPRAELIRQHIIQFKVSGQCRVWALDVKEFIESATPGYDIIFYDPPYEVEALARLLPSFAALLAPTGYLVYERNKKRADLATIAGLRVVQQREYGITVMDIYTPGTAIDNLNHSQE